MEKLWAPWRSRYIYLRGQRRCIFCVNRIKTKSDKKRYILDRSTHSFSMLNLYPYNNGHAMVAPFRHVRDLEELSDEELIDLIRMVKRTKAVLDKKLKPEGYNIGMNMGKVSGAGFDSHIHVHIVPRWLGDTNFMPIIANSKIVSDSLNTLYELLRAKK